jgi:hypothetical protein
MRRSVRILATLASTCLLLGSIGIALWQADGRYSLPTPRPDSLVQSASLATEVLARLRAAAGARSEAEPLLVHFYNPGCPCSRFNRDHVLGLVRDFGARVAELALVELPEGEPPGGIAFDEQLGMNALRESDGALARALGVYSTPQAVLLDGAGKVYFRGNYNQSRYCTREESDYVRIATTALLAGLTCPPMPAEALRAYGCELPNAGWKTGSP